MLHHNGFAGRENTLLMAIGLTLPQVFDHGQAHRFGSPVTKQARIADIQRDDLVTLALQFHRPVSQFTADFVADAFENVVCLDGCFMHGCTPALR